MVSTAGFLARVRNLRDEDWTKVPSQQQKHPNLVRAFAGK